MEEGLDPDQLGLQQDDGEIVEEDQLAEDSNDIDDTDTGRSEEDTDASDGDHGGNSGSSTEMIMEETMIAEHVGTYGPIHPNKLKQEYPELYTLLMEYRVLG